VANISERKFLMVKKKPMTYASRVSN